MRIFIQRGICHFAALRLPPPSPYVVRLSFFFYIFLPKSEITSCVSSVNMPRPNAENREGSPCVTKKRTKCRALWICTIYTDNLCPPQTTCLCLFGFLSNRLTARLCFCCKYQARLEFRIQVSYGVVHSIKSSI